MNESAVNEPKTTGFTLETRLEDGARGIMTDRPLGRTGILHTPPGDIETPAFIPVGTKATVKAV